MYGIVPKSLRLPKNTTQSIKNYPNARKIKQKLPIFAI